MIDGTLKNDTFAVVSFCFWSDIVSQRNEIGSSIAAAGNTQLLFAQKSVLFQQLAMLFILSILDCNSPRFWNSVLGKR